MAHDLAIAAIGAKNDPTLWYLTRAMAVSAYITLTVSVMLGIVRSIGRISSERVSWVVDELHQFIAVLAGVFVAGHLVTLVLDPFLPFSLANLVRPGSQPYAPQAVNIGVFALYALALVLLSSLVKRALPYGFWRLLHYASFLAFVLATLHGWLAGTDTATPWMRAVYGAAAGAVGFMVLVRIFAGPGRQRSVSISPSRTI